LRIGKVGAGALEQLRDDLRQVSPLTPSRHGDPLGGLAEGPEGDPETGEGPMILRRYSRGIRRSGTGQESRTLHGSSPATEPCPRSGHTIVPGSGAVNRAPVEAR
jgi:hypothetical protein